MSGLNKYCRERAQRIREIGKKDDLKMPLSTAQKIAFFRDAIDKNLELLDHPNGATEKRLKKAEEILENATQALEKLLADAKIKDM
mgnify:CR=1 FL=1